jgi:hypothetical protein
VHGHPVRGGFGFRRHGDVCCPGTCPASAIGAAGSRCKSKTRDCQTCYRATYQRRFSPCPLHQSTIARRGCPPPQFGDSRRGTTTSRAAQHVSTRYRSCP